MCKGFLRLGAAAVQSPGDGLRLHLEKGGAVEAWRKQGLVLFLFESSRFFL